MPNIKNKPLPERTFDGKKYTLYKKYARKDMATSAKAYLTSFGVKNHLVKVPNGYVIYVR